MIYFKRSNGEVFAYDTQAQRDEFGPADLVPMTEDEVQAHLNPPVVVQVPQVVTMRQARLALLASGKLAAVDAAISALPEPQKSAARIEWDYSSEVHRNRPFVQQLAKALGMTDEQLAAMFVEAAKL